MYDLPYLMTLMRLWSWSFPCLGHLLPVVHAGCWDQRGPLSPASVSRPARDSWPRTGHKSSRGQTFYFRRYSTVRRSPSRRHAQTAQPRPLKEIRLPALYSETGGWSTHIYKLPIDWYCANHCLFLRIRLTISIVHNYTRTLPAKFQRSAFDVSPTRSL